MKDVLFVLVPFLLLGLYFYVQYLIGPAVVRNPIKKKIALGEESFKRKHSNLQERTNVSVPLNTE